MAKIISASINLSKLDKNKIVKGKTGQSYCNISIVVNDEPDKYGYTVQITEGQNATEITEKAPKVYIGNGKVVWEGQSKNSTVSNKPKAETKVQAEVKEDDTLPF
jgi:hypothetical protein